jgi:hypothetical protein
MRTSGLGITRQSATWSENQDKYCAGSIHAAFDVGEPVTLANSRSNYKD